MDYHPVVPALSENSTLIHHPEEQKSEKSIPDHPMEFLSPMPEHEIPLKDRFESSIDYLIQKKTQEISYLNTLKSEYSPLFEVNHLKSILSNTFMQPIFAAEQDKPCGSTLLSAIEEQDSPSVISWNLSKLSNYSSITCDFLLISSMSINNIPVSDRRLNWKGRSLQVADDKILLTGGSAINTQTLLINTVTQEIQELGHLLEGRELHAMAWIDNKPAVLGGIDSNDGPLGSVEVFTKGCWEKARSMNKQRYGLSACTAKNSVWVFGGAESRDIGVLDIEVYCEGAWHTILTKIPQAMVGIGLVSLGDKILILGGMNNEEVNTNKVLIFNTETYGLRECKSLDIPCSFSQNLWKVHTGFIEGCTFRGNRIIYHLE